MDTRSGSLSRRSLGALQSIGEGEPGSRLLDPERPDGRPAQRLAIGVAEIGDQAPHVGPGGALDLELGAVASAPKLLEAIHRDQTLRKLHLLPSAGSPVGAKAAHLHGGVRRRTLPDLTRRK